MYHTSKIIVRLCPSYEQRWNLNDVLLYFKRTNPTIDAVHILKTDFLLVVKASRKRITHFSPISPRIGYKNADQTLFYYTYFLNKNWFYRGSRGSN